MLVAARGRALLRGAVMLAAAFTAGCGARTDAPAPPAAAPTVEDSVWAVVLDSLYVQPSTRRLVVRDSTTRIHRRDDRLVPDYVRNFDPVPGIERETVDDFRTRNLRPRAVTALPRTRVPVERVSEATIERFPTGLVRRRTGERMRFWRAFHKRYPDSSGLITLSRVGFNAARTQAVLSVDRNCGGRCADGTIILLARDASGRWRVVHTQGTWMA
jgi:hypothetical protein